MNGAGVTVFCDPTLRNVVRQVGAGAGYEVAILSAPAPLMVAQITRHTHNDVLWTESAAMDQAVSAGLVMPASRVDGFGNSLVLAAMTGWTGNIASARIAVTDATPASSLLDGRAVLAANHLATGPIQGAANTGDVAFLLTTGAADIGLLYLTDVLADARLKVVKTLSGSVAYSAAVNAQAYSPNAAAFLARLKASGPVLNAGGVSWA